MHGSSLLKAIVVMLLAAEVPARALAAPASAEAVDEPSPAAIQQLMEEFRYDDARVMAGDLLATTEALRSRSAPAVADALDLLVRAWIESNHPRSPELLNQAQRAVELREPHGEQGAGLARSLGNLADAYMALDQREDAVAVRRRALALEEALEGPAGPAVAEVLVQLGDDLRRSRQGEEATQALERALAIRETHFGPDSREAAEALSELALTLPEGDARRKPLAARALAIREQGASRPQDLARALTVLAIVLDADERDFEAAMGLYARALGEIEHAFGSANRRLDFILNNFGISLYYGGDVLEAQAAFERALGIRERPSAPTTPK